MRLNCTTRHIFSAFLLITLSGCLTQSDNQTGINEAPDYLLPALVKGEYQNADNNDVFVLDEQAHFLTKHGRLSKPYYIDKQHIVVVLKQSEGEKRPDLTLSIINNGETLNCPSCPRLNLANLWHKNP
ncbi:hypothetical protein [Vibrio europaeus]|uniref:Lipoprotein n=1 Tax=Vibrio europaeus TaxID=300876 RepID=A0A178J3V0_9VIBR|nr:hypothetical protein [Vibrio europaeus]MDC5708407.1 hypothetical protein [Vibrio europaeus]MDC5713140.1 hypothetical protein [Vibrio europaeus]MDC5728159.1 hypothetical protein [Vibrio europaeus]MDC5733246.1 hypothetical protein [Vibrio europaeus]MDC5742376.1 hypothetical protein [Vibrio europaeus]